MHRGVGQLHHVHEGAPLDRLAAVLLVEAVQRLAADVDRRIHGGLDGLGAPTATTHLPRLGERHNLLHRVVGVLVPVGHVLAGLA